MSALNYLSNPAALLSSPDNFFPFHNLMEADVMRTRLFTPLFKKDSSGQNLLKKNLSPHFDSPHQISPALYDLPENLDELLKLERKAGTYENEVSSKHIYASFKRHPE